MRRISFVIPILLVSLAMISCKRSADQPQTYFDSLIIAQVKYLAKANPTLTKVAMINGTEGQATLVPDSAFWKNELDVFRRLSLFEKPAYRDAYHFSDGLRDPKSNLVIRQYVAGGETPIPELKFYYFKHASDLKKIEAVYRQSNALYLTTRRLVLEFDEVKGKPVLSGYEIDGSQKMILSDSVKFSVRGKLTFTYPH